MLSRTTPEETILLSNYPNPFNPETWIPYQLAKPAAVTVAIYGTDGTLVRTLVLGHQPAGVYRSKSRAAYWDGKNEQGESVASGLYFYTLKAGEFTATRKLLLRK
ncbi:MAG: T9SS type A sorting domain-containing protein [Gammaproteobacteria bacterium]|nr:T9SS type A sorting domain-containing protein [Gammaproteobacteria bacterium]